MVRNLLALSAFAACNAPPEGLEIQLTPEAPDTTQDLVVTLVKPAVDPQGDEVQLRYAWTRDGAPVDLDGDRVLSAETARGQVWEVVVTPTDGRLEGLAAVATVTIQNAAPTGVIDVLPGAPMSDQALEASVTTSDADDDVVDVASWSWMRNGELVPALTGPVVPPEATTRGDRWAPMVTLNDGFGVTPAFVGDEVVVGNAPPSLVGATLAPDVLVEETRVSCVPQGWSDPDGDPLAVEQIWEINGAELPPDAGPELDGATFSRGDSIVCRLTPRDDFSTGPAVSSAASVVQNTPPTVASARIDLSAPVATDTLTVLTDGVTDPDGDLVALEVVWTVDGEVAATGPTFTGALRGQVVQAVITPFDGLTSGAAIATDPVTIQNAAPVLVSVGVGPSLVSVEGVARATASATDVDGDGVSFSYAWTRSGVPVGTAETLPLSAFARGDSLVVTVTPNDGTVDGAPVASAPLIIGNAPPRVTKITFSPAKPTAVETLRATVSTVDADGDGVSLAYAWTVRGALVSTKSEIKGGVDFKADDPISLKVTPNDGREDGAPTSASTVALGTRPTEPRAKIIPALPKAGDTLQCVVDEPSIDPDGGSVTHTVSWEIVHPAYGHTWARSTTTLANDTIDGSYIKDGQYWKCSISGFDGVEYGPSDVAYAKVSDGVERRAETADTRIWGVGVGPVDVISDVDGDGSDDLVFGRPDMAEVEIYAGDLAGDNDEVDADLLLLSGVTRWDKAGQALLTNVDFDDDGDLDLIVAAPAASTSTSLAGQGIIYLVPAPIKAGTLDKLATATLTGARSRSSVGYRLASTDFDGDGDIELLSAARTDTVGSLSSAGELYIVEAPFSGAMGLGSADTTIQGSTAGAVVGQAFAVGDTNGDGDDDVVVMSRGTFSWSGTTGECRWDVFEGPLASGKLGASTDMDHTIYPADKSCFTGQTADIGDFDADGYDDFLLIHEVPGKLERRVHIIDGDLSASAVSTTSASTTITDVGSLFPFQVSLGDVDASGHMDVVVTEVSKDSGGNIRIYLDLPAGAHDSTDDDHLMGGAYYGDWLAVSGVRVVDLDADGYDDVLTTGYHDDVREDRVLGAGLIVVFSGAKL